MNGQVTRRLARVALVAAALATSSCHGRPRLTELTEEGESTSTAKEHILQFDFGDGLPETISSEGLFGPVDGKSLSKLVLAVQGAQRSEDVKGFFLELGGVRLKWAQSEQLGELFRKTREQGKPVYCHAHSYNNTGLWFAAQACDRIYVSPAGDVDTVGIAAQVVYLKRLLERLNVHADFLHMGRYKSAAETLTREGPSEEAREALLHVLGSMRSSWLEGIQTARSVDRIEELVEDGPWAAERAMELGLVDAVGYAAAAKDDLEEKTGTDKAKSGFGRPSANRAEQIARIIQALAGGKEEDNQEPRIVVLPAAGSITMKPSGPFFSGGGIAAEPLRRTIRRLTKADSVKAVVLRIDSPGGSALASDLLWHELVELKKEKPLIVSVGDLAASGGYFMACAADAIVAGKTSIVGSIGVVGGKIVVGDAFAEYGVDTVTMSPVDTEEGRARAAYLSALTAWDEPTKKRVGDQMRAIYDLFIDRVAKGRGLPEQEVRKIAEGRIWSGAQGKELKLVDEIGGLSRAIELARERAKLPEDVVVEVEGGRESFLDMLLLDGDADEAQVRAALEAFRAARPKVLDLLPASTRVYAASLQPLLQGEKVLAVSPFAIQVE